MNTPESFSADFPFKANYVSVLGSQMHYVDEGEGDPILFLHGNPTSSYLWRNVIPHVMPFGRCIAPDLIGMGKSDKPDIAYRFFDHARYIDGFVEALGLNKITLVIHDWGSALGFYHASRHAQNIKAIAFMESILMPVPSWDAFPAEARPMFQQFRTPEVGWDLIVNKNNFLEQVMPSGMFRNLTPAEHEAYLAPFSDPASRKPVWQWPNELPIAGEPADVAEAVMAYNQWLQQWPQPKLMLFATPGQLITAPVVAWCQQHLANLTVAGIGKGLHYVQEDHPNRIGIEIANWIQKL
jgi:haloalkane dehalogenase